MRRIACVVGLLVIVAPMAAYGQSWSGILSPSRAIDWTNAGVPGGIPSRTTICATLNPGATAAQINNAVATCPSGQVVRLNAGTYTLNGNLNISKSNVTLQGAGADQTKLLLTANAGGNCFFNDGASLCLSSGENNWGQGGPIHTASWTAGYARGTTVVTLSNTTGLQVGNQLFLDQLDDSSDGWPAAGDIFVCSACSGEGGGHQRSGRSNLQVVTVTAINGNTVTISPGLHMPNWRASQSPGAWWGNASLRGVGIEDMSLDYGRNGGHPGIMLFNVKDSWIKGVRGVVPAQTGGGYFNHVRMLQVNRVTVRDNYFHGDFFDGNTMYGISLEATSDVLIENNIVTRNGGPLEAAGADQGSVFGYNFTIGNSANGWVVSSVVLHEAGESLMLFEGNSGSGLTSDIVHGTHHFITQFRNHWYGDPISGADTINWIQTYSRFFNVIGNVLGLTGSYNLYELNLDLRLTKEIFSLGDKRSASYPNGPDPRVKATMMRWGNYDTVNAAVRFLASEVPSGITNFANPVPASQALPPSFYLSARPAWWSTPWGTPPWPAVGPDVTGGNIGGYAGRAHKIPARLCYENSPIDSAYGNANIRAFNASSCYASVGQTVPAAPTSPVVQ